MRKAIPGYPGYEADEFGNIYSARRKGCAGGIVKTFINPNGYLYVSVCVEGKKSRPRVHKLVAAAFLGECPKGMEIDHLDRDRRNNAALNLEYVTHSENVRRSWRMRTA